MKLVAKFKGQKFFVGDIVRVSGRLVGTIAAFYLDDGEWEARDVLIVYEPGLLDNIPLDKQDYEREDELGLLQDCYGMDYSSAVVSDLYLIERPTRIKTLEEILFDL